MSEEAIKLQGIVPDHLKVRQSRILLDSLEVMTDIGFHEFEVGAPQRLLITVELWLEDLEPPHDDDHQSAFGQASRSAQATGSAWITSPMAVSLTIKTRGASGDFMGRILVERRKPAQEMFSCTNRLNSGG